MLSPLFFLGLVVFQIRISLLLGCFCIDFMVMLRCMFFGLVCMSLSFSFALFCWLLGPLLYTLCILFFINILLFTDKKEKLL